MHDLSYDEIYQRIKHLNSTFAVVHSAADLYSLPYSSRGGHQCSPLILQIGYCNHKHHSSDTNNLINKRPQLLLSGEIHGDERVVSD